MNYILINIVIIYFMINIVINDYRVNCFNNYNRNIHRNKIIISKQKHQFHRILSDLYNSNNDNNEVDDFFDDKRVAEMTLDEIKAELEVRGVNYEDCFSKGELVKKLGNARREGKATPEIFNQFNEISDQDLNNIDDDKIQDLLSKDGRLPGGLDPGVMKQLGSDPEIMTMLRDPKMQDIMKAVMTEGPQSLKKYTSDPDSILLLNQLTKAMERVMKKNT